jgi:hypothetical protein
VIIGKVIIVLKGWAYCFLGWVIVGLDCMSGSESRLEK